MLEPQSNKQIPPKFIQLAIQFGIIKEGYTLEDYIVEAVQTGGYETVGLWGVQGAGKSCRMLQMGYWVYKDWDSVLKHFVFKPKEFVKRLKDTPAGKRIPCLNWDDIGVHYTSVSFRTDIKQYEAVDAAWAAVRTKCNVIGINNPLIDRVAKNIRDNLTFEIFIGRNQMELKYRLVRLPNPTGMESNLFKVVTEEPARFNLYDVPRDVFAEYWEMRLRLTEEALEKLDYTVYAEDMEGYVPVSDAAVQLRLSANTLQSYISRGVYRGKKIKGVLCLDKEDFDKLEKAQTQIGRGPKRQGGRTDGELRP